MTLEDLIAEIRRRAEYNRKRINADDDESDYYYHVGYTDALYELLEFMTYKENQK